jgi:hypothetical protein
VKTVSKDVVDRFGMRNGMDDRESRGKLAASPICPIVE